MKRNRFVTAFYMIASLLLILFISQEILCQEDNKSDSIYFQVHRKGRQHSELWKLTPEGTETIVNKSMIYNGYLYKDRIYVNFINEDDTFDTQDGTHGIYSSNIDGTDKRTIFEYDREWVGKRPKMYIFSVIRVDDEYVWSIARFNRENVFEDKSNLIRIKHDASDWTVYEDVNLTIIPKYSFYKDWIYYIDSVTRHPYRTNPKDKKTEMLAEIEADWAGVFAVHRNKVWFQTMNYGNGTELWSMNLDGGDLQKSDLPYSGKLAFHDGWFYWFDGEHTDSNLYRTSVKGKTESLFKMYYCIDYWPSMNFGSKGMVISEDLTARDASCINYWYIPFDGSEAKLIESVKF